MYNADLRETDGGFFDAKLRDSDIAVRSRDPEHDLCHEMVKAGLPNGCIQFWRGAGRTPSMFAASIQAMAVNRITMGDEFPRQVKRQEGPIAAFEKSRPGAIAGGDFETSGTETVTRDEAASVGAPA